MEKRAIFMRCWDEEKKKFTFKETDEAPDPKYCCMYGNYMRCEEDKIQETKEALLEQMIEVIRGLAKRDEFWIVQKADDDAYTVAWRAEFTQMLPK